MNFIFFYILFFWFMLVFYKWSELDKPDSWLRNKIPNKGKFWDFVYKLSKCQLCMESHIGFLLALPIFIYNMVDYQGVEFFFYGWAAAGYNYIVKTVLNALNE